MVQSGNDSEMTSPQIVAPEKPRSSIVLAMLAGIISSYCMNKLSLAGVNFETLGVSSEIVKSTIVGNLVVFFAWATPTNIVNSIRATIIWCRNSWLSIILAAEQGKE